MTTDNSRSEQVVSAYKRHKLSVSALCHIRQLLRDFEREREFDRRLAWYGVALIGTILAIAALSRFGVERILLP